ncbi:MAG: hypothetical protein NC402_04680 [Prevotella sp.]|nr:hypothetical protein [Prevotella sp.]
MISVIFWVAVAFGAWYIIDSEWCTPTITIIVVVVLFALKRLWKYLQG